MARLNEFMIKADLTPIVEYCREFGSFTRYAKGDCLVTEGSVCRKVALVRQGYFKYATIDSSGNERITAFGFENEVVTDFVRSMQFGKTALTSIVAGCDSEVLEVPMYDLKAYLTEHNPEFIARLATHALEEAYTRYLLMHTLTPVERYRVFYPRLLHVIDKIPMRELASFLAVSRRQFQRIRSQV
ncbi:MAG: cyclic nucleotide-binding domain-containing protein [Muribaculaceae bacterium]|nr:cyclic nucleotide-binding domain-containing protein [Muribaculaceae bacterium]